MVGPSLPKSFKAAVLSGDKLKITEVLMPEVKDGEILIKVHACGICHSDHDVLAGHFGPPYVRSKNLHRHESGV